MTELRRYLNKSGFAQRIGLAIQSLAYREEKGLLPDPDVIVGRVIRHTQPIHGWSIERVDVYADYISQFVPSGRFTPLGSQQCRFETLPEQRPDWWHVPTEWYLNRFETAAQLGMQPTSVSSRRRRGTFPVDPVVLVGSTSHGWDQAEVMEYGQQEDYIDEHGRVKDGRRNGPVRRAVVVSHLMGSGHCGSPIDQVIGQLSQLGKGWQPKVELLAATFTDGDQRGSIVMQPEGFQARRTGGGIVPMQRTFLRLEEARRWVTAD